MNNTPPIGIPGASTDSLAAQSGSGASASKPIPIKFAVTDTPPNPFLDLHPALASGSHSSKSPRAHTYVKLDPSPNDQHKLGASDASNRPSSGSAGSRTKGKHVSFAGEAQKPSPGYSPADLDVQPDTLKGDTPRPKKNKIDRQETNYEWLQMPALTTIFPRHESNLNDLLDDSHAMKRIYQEVGPRILNMKQVVKWEEATSPFGKAAHKVQSIVGLRSPQDRMRAFIKAFITHPRVAVEIDPFVPVNDMYQVRFNGDERRTAYLSVGPDAEGQITVNTTRFDMRSECFRERRLLDFDRRLFTWQRNEWTIRYSASEPPQFDPENKTIVLNVRRDDNASVIRLKQDEIGSNRWLEKTIRQRLKIDAARNNPPDPGPSNP